MEVLFHFVFELFKIAILASLYATIIRAVISYTGRKKPGSRIAEFSKNKRRCWYLSGFTVSALLFIFMFTYWGDHGLGDNARIPIGHGKAVEQINADVTFIRARGHEEEVMEISDYATTSDFLFARKTGNSAEEQNSSIIVWNLETNDTELLAGPAALEVFKGQHHITEPLLLQDFQNHYSSYWNGWRFWLLA